MFFHNFADAEVAGNMGQLTSSSVSRRAAEAFLLSGVRLESTCGISGVWYSYVEKFRGLFEKNMPPKAEDGTAPPPPPMLESPCYLRPDQMSFMLGVLEWPQQHKRPRPRKKVPTANPSPILIASSSPIAIPGSPPIVITSSSPIIIASSPVHVGDSRDAQLKESADEVSNGPPSAPPPREDISEDTEHESHLGKGLSNESEELPRKPGEHTVGLDLGVNGAGDQAVGGISGEERDEFDGFELEDWPMTNSFTAELFEVTDGLRKVPDLPFVVTDTFISSSIPEEREFRLNSTTMGLTRSAQAEELAEVARDEEEGAEEEDDMEGVEPSQPSQDQAHVEDDDDVSLEESSAGEDEDEMDVQDGEYIREGV